MRKTAILPGMFAQSDADSTEPQMCYAVVTEREGYRKAVFSGGGVPDGDIEAQTRQQLEYFEEALVEIGGSYNDVTMMRWYVLAEYLDHETQRRLHEIRSEFFERPHYPASTMIGVTSLLHDCLVEIEMEAEIPDDDWDVETVEADELGS